MTEVCHRLDQLRSSIWWTAPLYAVFLGAGLYETGFEVTLALLALVAVLAAFGLLDGFLLLSLRTLQAELASRPDSLRTARNRLERLSRTVLLCGAAFGVAGLAAVLVLWLQA